MATYRFYKVTAGNRIVTPGVSRDFDEDRWALDHARVLTRGYTVGVWEGERFVGHVNAEARHLAV